MTGYYRGVCHNFATLVTPLTDLLKPSQNFVWTPECQLAFRLDKDILCKAPILAAPFFFTGIKLMQEELLHTVT